MKAVFVGAGNLATNLGMSLMANGVDVVQVYSRTEDSASALSEKLKCAHTTDIDEVISDADIYFISVKDSVLESLASRLLHGREDRLFVHTSGSMPMSALPFCHRGVFYPMQTFSKSKIVDFSNIPVFIEADDSEDLNKLDALAHKLSSSVYVLDSSRRRYLHLSAVFCCNFVNHCYAVSEDILKSCGVPFDVMLPLIDETSAKVHTINPKDAQTGPAVRYDENVIAKHLDLLSDKPVFQDIYRLMSDSIHKISTGE